MISLKIFGVITISVAIFSIIAGIPICKIVWKKFHKDQELFKRQRLLLIALSSMFILLGFIFFSTSFFLTPEEIAVKLKIFWAVYLIFIIAVPGSLTVVMGIGDMLDGISTTTPGAAIILWSILGLETFALLGYSITKLVSGF